MTPLTLSKYWRIVGYSYDDGESFCLACTGTRIEDGNIECAQLQPIRESDDYSEDVICHDCDGRLRRHDMP